MNRNTRIFLKICGALILLFLIFFIFKFVNFISQPYRFSSKYAAKETECAAKPVIIQSNHNPISNSKTVSAFTSDNPVYEQVITQYKRLKNPGIALFNMLFGGDGIIGMTCTIEQAREFPLKPGYRFREDSQNDTKEGQLNLLRNFVGQYYVPKVLPDGYKPTELMFPKDGSYYRFAFSKPGATLTSNGEFSFTCFRGRMGKSAIDNQYTLKPAIQKNTFYNLSSLGAIFPTYTWTQNTVPNSYESGEYELPLRYGKTTYLIETSSNLVCYLESGIYHVNENKELINSIALIDNFKITDYKTQISGSLIGN